MKPIAAHADAWPAEFVQARLGTSLALALTQASEGLSPEVKARLRQAREQALRRAARPHPATPAVRPAAWAKTRLAGLRATAAAAVLRGAWWQRLAPLLPLVVLVVGLAWIPHQIEQEQAQAMADFDLLLLADTLPPAAYADPGFAEFLRTTPTP